jgi:oxygen-independent coproporphyrinogen-3 oxidase
MSDLLVYVGIPFCASKCHFCFWVADMAVRDLRWGEDDPPRRAYIDALVGQIRHQGPRLAARGYTPRLMYWGGGTASALSVREFERVMTALREHLDLSGVAEATMECSPESVTAEKLAAYRAAGFDRISIGVQSFHDHQLTAQGRSHRSAQARESILLADAAGFREINVDLMCGLPGEDVDEFDSSATTAVDLPVSHVSLYPFVPIVGTVTQRQIHRGTATFDCAERLAAFERGRELFEAAGLPEYALGYFGRRPCRADVAYYGMEMDWIGFGARANSVLDGAYLATASALDRYVADPLAFVHRGSAGGFPHFIRQGLGLFEGVAAQRWQERTGMALAQSLGEPAVVAEIGYLVTHPRLIHDQRGIRFDRADQLAALFGCRS